MADSDDDLEPMMFASPDIPKETPRQFQLHDQVSALPEALPLLPEAQLSAGSLKEYQAGCDDYLAALKSYNDTHRVVLDGDGDQSEQTLLSLLNDCGRLTQAFTRSRVALTEIEGELELSAAPPETRDALWAKVTQIFRENQKAIDDLKEQLLSVQRDVIENAWQRNLGRSTGHPAQHTSDSGSPEQAQRDRSRSPSASSNSAGNDSAQGPQQRGRGRQRQDLTSDAANARARSPSRPR